MDFQPGELAVWVYRSQAPKRTQYIAAEGVQPGRLRVRSRIQLAEGHMALRWVKQSNLCRNGSK